MAKTIYDVLQEKLEDHKKSHTDFLASGRAADYALYQNQCGIIRGLDLALREINDLAQNFMDESDE
jgi:hypothetical protein